MNAPQKNQLLAMRFAQWIQGQVDSVVDRFHVVESGRPIGVANGNEVSVAIFLVDAHDLR